MANLFSVKQTLRWGLACRIFVMRCFFWVNTYEKEGTEAGLGRGRSQGMTQFYSKAFTSLTRRSSEAERGPHSCPGWGVMAFTSLGGPDFGGEE